MSTIPPLKGTKRPHRKSRTGCVECKRRKIKCDETKPCCKKCAVHSISCSFLQLHPAKLVNGQVKQHVLIGPKPPALESSAQSSQTTSPTPESGVADVAERASSQLQSEQYLNMVDLELLYHYTMHTSVTLVNDEAWQVNIPKLAFSCDFLMHGILALSALHLSFLRKNEADHFIKISDAHHERGLRTFQPALAKISPKNSFACYGFSLLLIVMSWASPTISANLFIPDGQLSSQGEHNVVDLIQMVRGTVTIIKTAQSFPDWGAEGPLSSMFEPFREVSRVDHSDHLPKPVENMLQHLVDTVNYLSTPQTDKNETEILKKAIQLLRKVYEWALPDTGLPPVSAAIAWVAMLPLEYNQMVRSLNQMALIILAHYCPVLKKTENTWWLRGKAEVLLNNCRRALKPEMEKWIEWPLQEFDLLHEARYIQGSS